MKNFYIWIFTPIAFILALVFLAVLADIFVGAYFQRFGIFANDVPLSTKIAALSTTAIAFLTIFLAWETRQLRHLQIAQIKQIRKNGIKPNVNAYLKRSPAASSILDIHIVNSGPGVAQNIKFTFTDQSKDKREAEACEYLYKEINKISMLKNGISSLAIGEKRHSIFLNALDKDIEKYKDKIYDQVIKVDIKFKDIEDKEYPSTSYLNLSEYASLRQAEPVHPLYIISKSLEKIQKEIGHFATGHKRLSTDVYNSADRDEERKLLEKRWAEQQKQENKDSKKSDTDD